MTEASELDRPFQAVMRWFVDTGRAPHYTDLARVLGGTAAEGRRTLRAVVDAFFPAWLHPETDYIASFPPFNSLPTQYRVSVRGQQKWFAQCGFEALSVTWLFPGETVRVDAPCLDCNEPLTVEMRDGEFLRVDPAETIGHLNHPWIRAKERLAFL